MSSKKRSSVSKEELSLRMGLSVLVLSLVLFIGIDTKGWGSKAKTFVETSLCAITISKNYENLYCFIFFILLIYANQNLFPLNNYNRSNNKIKSIKENKTKLNNNQVSKLKN